MMNVPNLQLDEREDPACTSAVRSGPPPAPPPAALEQSWPRSGQWAVVCIVSGIVLLLVLDRFQTQSDSRPTSANTSPRRELNHVSRAELLQLPGVGPLLADRLLAYRAKIGRFNSVDELQKVPGVGEKLTRNLGKWFYVVGDERAAKPRDKRTVVQFSTPVDINRATPAELQKLPRIGPVLAQRIIDERAKAPFKSADDLRRVYGIGPKTVERLRRLVVVK